jgi:hypothetical protein
MTLPRRTDVLKLPTRDCAARSDLLNAEDGEAEPFLTTNEPGDATSDPQAKEIVSKLL